MEGNKCGAARRETTEIKANCKQIFENNGK